MQESPFKGARGVRRLLNATRYTLQGLAAAFRHEEAFRLELLLALVLIPSAFFVPVGGVAKALMVASVLLVLIVELLNSALEAAVDRISLERHSLAQRAKDLGSAAVFLSLVNVGAVWLLVLLG
jgi:diacylglycerol kinase (ATP)